MCLASTVIDLSSRLSLKDGVGEVQALQSTLATHPAGRWLDAVQVSVPVACLPLSLQDQQRLRQEVLAQWEAALSRAMRRARRAYLTRLRGYVLSANSQAELQKTRPGFVWSSAPSVLLRQDADGAYVERLLLSLLELLPTPA